MNLFDDAQLKDIKTTVFLGLKSSKNQELSTWEISRYIFDLKSEFHNKE